LGSYKGRRMLFLGLGTGLGTTLITDGAIAPMELGHLPYRKATYEDYVGLRGLKKYGRRKWREYVANVVERLVAALEPEDVVLGGGNVKQLKELPAGCRAGENANAFLGGFRLWENGTIDTSNNSPQSGSSHNTTQSKRGLTNPSLSQSPAGQKLEAHYQDIGKAHLRSLFHDDRARGERMIAKAAGIFFDYSKQRVTEE